MARKKRSLATPPIEWVDKLELHTGELRRVRMLWRRGGGDYRPMIPLELDLDELEAGPQSAWDRHEFPDTNFEWDTDETSDPHEEIQGIVEELWSFAVERARKLGGWCDFQLIGYGANDVELFVEGRRCQLHPPERSSEPRAGADPFVFDSYASDRAAEKLDARKDKFIERLTSDRDWSFDTAQQAMSAAPALFERAGEILRDTIVYQQDIVRQLTERSNGHVEFRSRAFEEMEKTRRFRIGAELLHHGVESMIGSLIPFANRVTEVMFNHRIMVFPEFKSAQMAMSYLAHSLRPSALLRMLDNNRQAAGAVVAVLTQASRMPDEREALHEIGDLMDLFRSERFEDNAGPEEQLAARFIISRYSMYMMGEVGEDAQA